jgi:hypothetical protein
MGTAGRAWAPYKGWALSRIVPAVHVYLAPRKMSGSAARGLGMLNNKRTCICRGYRTVLKACPEHCAPSTKPRAVHDA